MGDAVSGLLPSAEEMADLKHKMAEMEAELKRHHSVMPELQCMCACVLHIYTCVMRKVSRSPDYDYF